MEFWAPSALLVGDATENGIHINVEVDEAERSIWDPRGSRSGKEPVVEEGIYRIIQEALNNIIKHSHAQNISIKLQGNQPGMPAVQRS